MTISTGYQCNATLLPISRALVSRRLILSRFNNESSLTYFGQCDHDATLTYYVQCGNGVSLPQFVTIPGNLSFYVILSTRA